MSKETSDKLFEKHYLSDEVQLKMEIEMRMIEALLEVYFPDIAQPFIAKAVKTWHDNNRHKVDPEPKSIVAQGWPTLNFIRAVDAVEASGCAHLVSKWHFIHTTLCETNYKFVVSRARAYINRCTDLSFDQLDEFTQEGYEGLSLALLKHDPNKTKLLTYAGYWIDHKIRRAAIAIRKHKKVLSLDEAREGEKSEGYYYALTAGSDNVEREALNNAVVEQCLNMLPARERTVVGMKYGVDGHDRPMIFDDIAPVIDRSQQRAQQIEADAIKNMKRQLRTIFK